MIPLTNSGTDKLQLVTDSAANIDVMAGWTDYNGSAFTPGRSLTAISSATTTDIVATPGASSYRAVENLYIRNRHATLQCIVTVVYDNNGTDYELHKATLLAGDVLEYVDKLGFFVVSGAAKLDMVKYVTANSVHATAATFAEITGLGFPVTANKNYAFQCMMAAITNATTTGAQFGIGGVAMTYMLAAGISTLLGSPTASATITTGVATAVDTAVMAQTTGAAANQPHLMWGGFTPSASGTLSIKATSEVTVAAGLTVLKGSWAWIRETDN